MTVQQHQFGLRVWRGEVRAMTEPHQHSEVEINLVRQGRVRYLFGGRPVALEAGGWVVFWGALPHRLFEAEPGTEFLWLTLPLADFLRFGLPQRLTDPVLHGRLVQEQDPDDLHRFEQWRLDWEAGGESRTVLRLELEARLRRLALKLSSQLEPPPKHRPDHADKAVRMAQLVVARYDQPLQIPEVAAAAGLHPNYASGLFKQTFGMTILEYLTQHRLAHAQRLLATTDRPVLEIAFEAGFGSSSRFYAAFERSTGQSPVEFRRAVQRG